MAAWLSRLGLLPVTCLKSEWFSCSARNRLSMAEHDNGALPPHPVHPVKTGKGSWRHAAFHVATTIATPAAYAALPFALASLGWAAGMGMLVVGTLATWYCSFLVASLWEWDGVQHTTYRDLAKSIFGRQGYLAVAFFQQLASIGNNITVQIAAGSSMKAIYKIFHEDNKLTLQQSIAVFGVFELALSQFPNIHSLRWVNAICTLSTLGFTATAMALSIYSGLHLDRAIIDYQLHGTTSTKVFGVLNALGTIAFSFGDAMLPEIQSTLKKPVKTNMYKGVSGAYTVIVTTYWTLACVGYWAFGSSVAPYLINSLTGPKWALVLVNLFAIIQIAGCYQIYCRPTYDYFEQKMVKMAKWQTRLMRLASTSIYIIVITIVAVALPFFGDFVALCGAFGFTPLDFIIPVIAYLVVRHPKGFPLWAINLSIGIIYTCVALLGTIGALRFISIDTQKYKLFNNM